MRYENDGLPLSPRLRRAAQRLAAEEVAAVYRHDLTGKLGAARMLVQTLKRGAAGSDAKAAGKRARETMDLLESSLTAALARLERSLLPPKAEALDPVDLAELVHELLSPPELARLVRVVAPGPVWVEADADELGVAVATLVENALEAAQSSVEVRCASKDERAELEVIDDGPGLPDAGEDVALFVSNTPGRLGLGLRIVKRIARRCLGRFDVRREAGITIARLDLPAVRGAP